MNPFSEASSAEVADEVETERAGLVNTLDQLRENLRPENVVDEVFARAQAGSSDLVDKVWRLARANPVPATLIGLGAAMLASAGQRFKGGRTTSAFSASEPMSATMETRRFSPLSGLSRLIEEQPFVLAALGVAVGAAVGSAIPSTDIEGEWLGDSSEVMRRNANAMAREQLTQFRTTASQTLDQMKATAVDHGVSSENVSGLIHDLGEQARTAASSFGSLPPGSR